MNSRNYRRRIEVISKIIFHKAVAYHLERTRGKWETTRVAIYGKISMRSLFIGGPVTPSVNEPYGTIMQRKLEISFAANEEITARKIETSNRVTAVKMKYQAETRDVTSTGIIMKTMIVRKIRATEMMDPG